MYMTETIQTKIKATYDVVVCGGGFAGISAALAAARQKKKVLLLEKQFILGGLGTAGVVTIYLPLCDGCGRQVSFGIAEELLRLSVRYGAEDEIPYRWLAADRPAVVEGKRFLVQYNPQMFAILAEDLLISEGVDILYGTAVVNVTVRENKITHIITENKSGREAYNTLSVVDATGDCDVAAMAEVPTETFKQGNVLAAWYYGLGQNGYQLHTLGFADVPDAHKKDLNGPPRLVERRFGGLDGQELSEQVCMAHQNIFRDFLRKQKEDPSFILTSIATIPQVRMTRRIIGEYTLDEEESHVYFDDSVGMISNWKQPGPVYEVPFRTLYNRHVLNLICAGRCVSATESMWDIIRVIPCCAVTGQAAGTAAAMTDDFTGLSVKELQNVLRQNGVVLHESR